ncbi:MAG: diguanylate cyclase [Acidobacteria bacterium]|nr:diguanylate cyclase [Acidobacteriota bacterium]MBI3663883.1 diguanylate cyclase [Acidobacteriota bacterium]
MLAQTHARKTRCKVLLVEDSPPVARVISELLTAQRSAQFEVEWVDRLASGLESMSRNNIDVVLLDLNLPDSQGIETCQRALAMPHSLPIVVMSGLTDEALALAAVEEGAQDFLIKGQTDGDLLVRTLRHAIQRHRLQNRLKDLTLRDDLTGLYNRRGFLTLAEQQLKLARRSGQSLTLVFADLDNLKQINDTFGHAAGDDAIRAAGEVLHQCFRDSDIIARIGGDEFTVFLVDAADQTGDAINERLHAMLQAYNHLHRSRAPISITAGAARRSPGSVASIDEFLSLADASLYRRKRARVAV